MEASNQAVGSFVAKRIKQDKSRQKKIDKIKAGMIQKAEQDSDIKVRLSVNREEKRTPMTTDDLCFSYDKTVKIIQNASSSIYLNERFVLIGENGAGKTTFLKLLAGKLTPDRGQIFKGSKNNSEYDRILENLKPPIFWKDKPIIQQQLRKWNLKKIEEMLFKIAETEILMKKNSYIKNNVIINSHIRKRICVTTTPRSPN